MCTDEGIISDSSTCSKMQIGRLTFKKSFLQILMYQQSCRDDKVDIMYLDT